MTLLTYSQAQISCSDRKRVCPFKQT